MTDKFEVTVELGFIRVAPTETEDSRPVEELFTRVLDAARNAGVSKIIYDVRRSTGQLSTIERFEYGSLIAEQFKGFKVAFVVNLSLRDPHLFGETVAVNRGADIRVFATLSEAYEWLEVQPAGKAAGGDGT